MKNKGFTLIELLVAILIIGILAAIAFPLYQNAVEKAIAIEGVELVSEIRRSENRYMLQDPTGTIELDDLDIQIPYLSRGKTGTFQYYDLKNWRLVLFRNNPCCVTIYTYRTKVTGLNIESEKKYFIRSHENNIECINGATLTRKAYKKYCQAFGYNTYTPLAPNTARLCDECGPFLISIMR